MYMYAHAYMSKISTQIDRMTARAFRLQQQL